MRHPSPALLGLWLAVAACGAPAASGPQLVAPDTGGDAAADAADIAGDTTATADGAGDDATTGTDDTGAGDSGSDDTDIAADIEPDGGSDDDASVDGSADGIDDGGTGSDASDGGGTVQPDGPQPCETDEHCSGATAGKRCDPVGRLCVACLETKDCNAGQTCEAHVCVDALTCKSDVECKATDQVCDKAGGKCVACNSDADCAVGSCIGHACTTVKPCKSSKECDLVCDTKLGQCVECESSDDCPAAKYCQAGQCKADLCQAPGCAGGKAFACKADGSGFEVGKGCDDADACTEGDACSGGVCAPGPKKACDDGNPCTDDSCDAEKGCVTATNKAACDDGVPCTIDDGCVDGGCKGNAKSCDDLNPCTTDACDAANGACTALQASGPCDDGDACTKDDACDAGKCKSGGPQSCDDGSPCTTDSCDKVVGCKWVALTGGCNDGSDCTSNDTCKDGKCAGVGKQCVDDNPCTDDTCLVGECIFKPNTKSCDDGNSCSSGDACVGGKCAGKVTPCDDKNPCTTDTCSSGKCGFSPNTAPCDDADPCTEKDACKDGYCLATKKACDDGNPCTIDSCDKQKGCVQEKTTGTSCGEPGSCATCDAGVCKGGVAPGHEKFFGATGADVFFGAVPSADGSARLYGAKAMSSGQGWLAKVDSKGYLEWEKNYGGSSNDGFLDGTGDGDGVVTVVGYRGGDGWIARIDASGAVVWEEQPGTTSYSDQVNAMTPNAKGFALVGRQYYSSSSSTTYYSWVVQVDDKGLTQWSKQFAGNAGFFGVAMLGDTIAVSGLGVGAKGGQDVKVKLLEPGGTEVWNLDLGNNSTDLGGGMIKVGDDLLVYGAYYISNLGYSMLAARVDSKGKVKWELAPGTIPGQVEAAVVQGSTLVLAGSVTNSSQKDGKITGVQVSDGGVLWNREARQSAYYEDRFDGVVVEGNRLLLTGTAYSAGGQGAEGWLLRLSLDGKLGCECDGSYDDGNACTTQDHCYLGVGKTVGYANKGTACVTEATPGICQDFGVCKASCGNKWCETGENNANCPSDCKPSQHPCNSICGSSSKHPTYGCYCDADCKVQGDCCTMSGTKASSCAGSTCGTCQ